MGAKNGDKLLLRRMENKRAVFQKTEYAIDVIFTFLKFAVGRIKPLV